MGYPDSDVQLAFISVTPNQVSMTLNQATYTNVHKRVSQYDFLVVPCLVTAFTMPTPEQKRVLHYLITLILDCKSIS